MNKRNRITKVLAVVLNIVLLLQIVAPAYSVFAEDEYVPEEVTEAEAGNQIVVQDDDDIVLTEAEEQPGDADPEETAVVTEAQENNDEVVTTSDLDVSVLEETIPETEITVHVEEEILPEEIPAAQKKDDTDEGIKGTSTQYATVSFEIGGNVARTIEVPNGGWIQIQRDSSYHKVLDQDFNVLTEGYLLDTAPMYGVNGLAFKGWSDGENLYDGSSFTIQIEEDTTLSAVLTEGYSITLDAGEGVVALSENGGAIDNAVTFVVDTSLSGINIQQNYLIIHNEEWTDRIEYWFTLSAPGPKKVLTCWECNGDKYDIGLGITADSDIVLNAVWEEGYIITLSPGEGTGTTKTCTVPSGGSFSLRKNGMVVWDASRRLVGSFDVMEDHYSPSYDRFLYGYTDGDTVYCAGDEIYPEDDMHLTAVWEQGFTIYLDSGDGMWSGHNNPHETLTITAPIGGYIAISNGELSVHPPLGSIFQFYSLSSSVAGYTFVGIQDQTGTIHYPYKEISYEEGMVYTAIWEENGNTDSHTVSFFVEDSVIRNIDVPNNSYLYVESDSGYYAVYDYNGDTVEEDFLFEASPLYGINGKVLKGWSDGIDLHAGAFSIPVDHDISLSAILEDGYTVTLDAGEGIVAMSEVGGATGDTVSFVIDADTAYVTLERDHITILDDDWNYLKEYGFSVTRSGYLLTGWRYNDIERSFGEEFGVGPDMVLEAVWEPGYSITLDPGEGSGDVVVATVPYGGSFILSYNDFEIYDASGSFIYYENINQNNYNNSCFLYEYTDGNNVYVAGEEYFPQGNLDLTAVWEQGVHIYFDPGEGINQNGNPDAQRAVLADIHGTVIVYDSNILVEPRLGNPVTISFNFAKDDSLLTGFTGSDGISHRIGSAFVPVADMVYTAVWAHNQTAHLESGLNDGEYYDINAVSGGSIVFTDEYIRTYTIYRSYDPEEDMEKWWEFEDWYDSVNIPFEDEGRVICGWTDGENTYPVGEPIYFSGETDTFTAIWKDSVEITLSPGQGEGDDVSFVLPSIANGVYINSEYGYIRPVQITSSGWHSCGDALYFDFSKSDCVLSGFSANGATYDLSDLNDAIPVSESTTFEAVWEEGVLYTITVSPGEGEGEEVSFELPINCNGILIEPDNNSIGLTHINDDDSWITYSYKYYNFWYEDHVIDGFLVNGTFYDRYDLSDPIAVNGDTSLEAVWVSAMPHTVTLTGGEGAEGKNIILTINHGEYLYLDEYHGAFTRSGYQLTGWESDGEEYATWEDICINKDITLEAIWGKIATITFDPGEYCEGTQVIAHTYPNMGGNMLSLYEYRGIFHRNGYVQTGWTDGTEQYPFAGHIYLYDDTILYPVWEEAVPITISAGDASGDAISVYNGYQDGVVKVEAEAIGFYDGEGSANGCSYSYRWEPYILIGLNDGEQTYYYGDEIYVSGPLSLDAIWDECRTITVRSGEGEFYDGSTEHEIKVPSTYSLAAVDGYWTIFAHSAQNGDVIYGQFLSMPYRDGYILVGWRDNTGNEYPIGSMITPEDGLILEPVWAEEIGVNIYGGPDGYEDESDTIYVPKNGYLRIGYRYDDNVVYAIASSAEGGADLRWISLDWMGPSYNKTIIGVSDGEFDYPLDEYICISEDSNTNFTLLWEDKIRVLIDSGDGAAVTDYVVSGNAISMSDDGMLVYRLDNKGKWVCVDSCEFYFDREGYELTGFEINGEPLNYGELYVVTETVVISSVWVGSTYTVTFTGGEGSSGEDVVMSFDSHTDLYLHDYYDLFTRDGYQLTGWICDGYEYGIWDIVYLTSDKVFEAVWGKVATIIFDPGEYSSGDQVITSTYPNNDGYMLSLDDYCGIFVRDGYVQTGWTDGTYQYSYSGAIYLSDDTTLYPIWEEGVPITISAGDGSEDVVYYGYPGGVVKAEKEAIGVYADWGSSAGCSYGYLRDPYTIIGLRYDGEIYHFGEEIPVSGPMQLEAVLDEKVAITISCGEGSFAGNDAEEFVQELPSSYHIVLDGNYWWVYPPENENTAYDCYYIQLERDGYLVIGWMDDQGNEYHRGDAIMPTNGMILEPIWTETIDVTIRSDLEGFEDDITLSAPVNGYLRLDYKNSRIYADVSLDDMSNSTAVESRALRFDSYNKSIVGLTDGTDSYGFFEYIPLGDHDTEFAVLWEDDHQVTVEDGESGLLCSVPVADGRAIRLTEDYLYVDMLDQYGNWIQIQWYDLDHSLFREGYIIRGFEIDGTALLLGERYVVTEDVLVQAEWSGLITVTVIPGEEGSGDELAVQVGYGTTISFWAEADSDYHTGMLRYGYLNESGQWAESQWANTHISRDGYVLVGLLIGDTVINATNYFTVTEDITLTPVWAEAIHITMEPGEGEGSSFDFSVPVTGRIMFSAEQNCVFIHYDDTSYVLADGFSRYGWDLEGYRISGFESDGTIYGLENDISAEDLIDGMVFTAVWEPYSSTCTVTITGGEGAVGEDIVIEADLYDYIDLTEYWGIFSKEGFSQIGWRCDGENYERWSELYVTGDMTVTARWAESYTVTFVPDEGAVGEPLTVEVPPTTWGYGTVKLRDYSTIFSKDGYLITFFTDGQRTYELNQTLYVSENMTLTPIWAESMAISVYRGYAPNGDASGDAVGEYTPVRIDVYKNYGGIMTVGPSVIWVCVDERQGNYAYGVEFHYDDHVLIGLRSGDDIYYYDDIIRTSEGMELEAVWDDNIPVTFLAGEGEFSGGETQITRDIPSQFSLKMNGSFGKSGSVYTPSGSLYTSYIFVPVSRDGYEVIAWKDQNGNEYSATDTIIPTEGLTLEPVWAESLDITISSGLEDYDDTVDVRGFDGAFLRLSQQSRSIHAITSSSPSEGEFSKQYYIQNIGPSDKVVTGITDGENVYGIGDPIPIDADHTEFSLVWDDLLTVTVTPGDGNGEEFTFMVRPGQPIYYSQNMLYYFERDDVNGNPSTPVNGYPGIRTSMSLYMYHYNKEGYILTGFLAGDNIIDSQHGYGATEDVTISPIWSEAVNISFNPGEGEGSEFTVSLPRTGRIQYKVSEYTPYESNLSFDYLNIYYDDTDELQTIRYFRDFGWALDDAHLAGLRLGDTVYGPDSYISVADLEDGTVLTAVWEREGIEFSDPTYDWASDNSTVTATRTAVDDPSIVETETVETEYAVTAAATCEEAGVGTYTATFTNSAFAQQTKEVEIPATGHVWGEVTYDWSSDNSEVTATRVCSNDASHVETETVGTTYAVTTDPTCEDTGTVTYTAVFENTAFAQQTKEVEIAATGHSYQLEEFVWSDDYSSATAVFVCQNDEDHVEEVPAVTTLLVNYPTCETYGKKTYTANVEFEGEEYSDTQIKLIEPIGHDWDEPSYEWSEDNSQVTATRVCANNPAHIETETAAATYRVTTAATCEAVGEGKYTAVFENEAFLEQTKTVEIAATGHSWGAPTYSWSDDYSEATATRICLNDSSHVETETVETDCIELVASTCEEAGLDQYTAVFENEAFEEQTIKVEVEAMGHSWGIPDYEWSNDYSQVTATVVCDSDDSHVMSETAATSYAVTTPATCEDEGVGTYTAVFENEEFEEQSIDVEIAATGHSWGAPTYTWSTDNKTVTAKRICNNDSSHVETETVSATAVTGATGITYTASFENEAFSEQTKTVPLSYTVKINTPSNTVSGLKLTWNSVDDPYFDHFTLYRTEAGKNSWTKVADNITAATYTDNSKTLKGGTAYQYKVAVVTSDGRTYESAARKYTYIGATTMNAPTCTAAGLRVTWPKVEGAVQYEIYRFIGSGTPTWKKIATVEATNDALQVYNNSVKETESGKWYAYTVRAIAEDRTKGAQPGGRSVRYRAPVQVTKVESTTTGVKVTFNTVDAGYTYMLYRSTKKADGTWTAYEQVTYKCYVYNEASRSKTITDTTAKSGQTYRYYVRCMSKDLAVPLSSYKNYKEIRYKKPTS